MKLLNLVPKVPYFLVGSSNSAQKWKNNKVYDVCVGLSIRLEGVSVCNLD